MGTIRDLMIRLGVDADVEAGLSKAVGALETAEGKFKAVATGAGMAVGAGLTAGLIGNMNLEAANDKLAAQLGASGPEAEKLGKVAGDLYGKGFGDSIESVNDALRSVMQNIEGMSTSSEADLKKVTGAVVNLGDAFGQDVGETSRAVGQMIRTGIAEDATQALDILTVGFQKGGDRAGDLLDTFSEYSVQFKKLGLDADDAMGMLSQGLAAGARDVDVAADALKEFAIRAIDGSDTTKAGFEALGLSSTEMAAKFAKGGDAAKYSLDEVMRRLREMQDPVKQNAAAVALFGTQAEDLGDALLAMDPSVAAQSLGTVAGAAEAMGKTLSDNANHKIEELKRGFEQMLQSAAAAPGALGTAGAAVAAFGAPALTAAGDIGALVAGFGGLAAKAGTAIAGVVTSFGTMVASAATATAKTIGSLAAQGAKWLWLGVQSLLHAAKVAAAWLIALGPIGIIIAAVIAVVALIVANWDTIKEAIATAWEWIKEKTSVFWEWLKGVVKAAVDWVVDIFMNWTLPGLIIKHWESIKTGAKLAWDWVVNKLKEAGQFILNIFMNWTLPGLILKHWDSIKSAAVAAWNWVVDKIKGAVNGIVNAVQGIAAIPGKVSNWFNEMKNAAVQKALDLANWLKGLPDRIIGALGNVGRMLWNAGASILQGLIDGIWSKAQQAYNSAKEILDRIRSLFPFSPAKEGPFSGKGWVKYSGESIGREFSKGLESQQSLIVSSAASIMDDVSGIFSTTLSPSVETLSGGFSATNPPVGGMSTGTPSYSYQNSSGSSSGGGVTIQGDVILQFADDRDMYQKGADFAAGLREYQRRGGVIPTNAR